MKIYSTTNVFDAALQRMRFLFDEFDDVVVSFSGGKDSTVLFNLAMKVAEEKGRTPLTVMFIDQEAEWDATIRLVRQVMQDDDVNPRWYQMPIRILNSVSHDNRWVMCWAEGEEWIRDKEEYSIHENTYGTDRFNNLFRAIAREEYPGRSMCYLSGVRVEESPSRYMGLTASLTYKWITWGSRLDGSRRHYTFYPLYDWSYRDIWKAIFSNGWEYNDVYKYYFCDGIPFRKMRVSNLHHEKAVHSLVVLQRYEPETFERVVERVPGADMAGKLGSSGIFISELPYMFGSWREYRDYLLEHLIDEEHKPRFRDKFRKLDELTRGTSVEETLLKAEVNSIVVNDIEFTKLDDSIHRPEIYSTLKDEKQNRKEAPTPARR